MLVDIQFCELHTPLFFMGVNFGIRLGNKPGQTKREGLDLKYDRAEKELEVRYKGYVVLIPSSNIATLWLEDPTQLGQGYEMPIAVPEIVQVSHPMRFNIQSAQVETPMGHVFQGEGHGKTGRPPGRPRKSVSDSDNAGTTNGEVDSVAMPLDASAT